MTELVPSDARPFVPPGRPVPRFVAAIVVVAALLVGVAGLGVLRPDVHLVIDTWRVDGDHAIARASITNTGRFPIDVTSIDGDGLRRPAPLLDDDVDAVDAVELEPGRALGSVRLGPDETVQVTAVLVPDCSRYVGPTGPSLAVDTEVVFGIERVARTGSSAGDAFTERLCRE